jgi:hypothetical protein
MTEYVTADEVRKAERGSTNKYGAKKTEVDGITFDSRLEARRYVQLKALQAAGEIHGLKLQPRYEFVVNGVRVGRYTPDFQYMDNEGDIHTEDAKGVRGRDLTMRLNLMRACHGVTVELWPARKPKRKGRRVPASAVESVRRVIEGRE